MVFTGQRAWFVSTNKHAAVTQWATGAVKAVGALVRQLAAPADGSERVWVCIVGGTTHATTEPTWTLTRGTKTTDNTVTWMECTGVAGMNGDVDNTPNWTTGAKSTTPSLGHVIKSGDGTKLLICTTSGAAGSGAEPTWAAAGGTTSDGAAVWTTLKDGSARYAAFAAPHHHLISAQGTNWGDAVAGSTQPVFFVGDSHNYTSSVTTGAVSCTTKGTFTAPIDIICISEAFAGTTPTTGDISTGGKEGSGSGTDVLAANGFARVYGMTFILNGNSGTLSARFGNGVSGFYFENCRFEISQALSTIAWCYGFSGTQRHTFVNCVWKFAHANQGILTIYTMTFIGCSVDAGGTQPTNIFNPVGVGSGFGDGLTVCRGCDWSFCTTPFRLPDGIQHSFLAHNCKLPASGTMIDTSPLSTAKQQTTFGLITASGNDGKLARIWYGDVSLTIVPELTAVRTGGASVNGDLVSMKATTGSQVSFAIPGHIPIFSNYNPNASTNVTATIYGIINAAAVPTNAELCASVDWLGTASSAKSSRAQNRQNSFLDAAVNLTADTSAWDSVASARQNSHTYSVGDMIKVASNPGRLFFCTASSGNTAGSEPGGYATAVDGGAVTDGSATFRAGCRFKISFAFNGGTYAQPQAAGSLVAQVLAMKASTTWFIDPFLELT